jgi:hypothetical protein
MVRFGTRTYRGLIDAEYEIIDDYYLIQREDCELMDAIHEETRRRETRGGPRLTFTEITVIRNRLDGESRLDQL